MTLKASLGMGSTATCFAPAKINLALHVTGQRNDGYHLLDSLVVFADVGDTISVARLQNVSDTSLLCQFCGPFGRQLDEALAKANDHLILKAARNFQNASGMLEQGVSVQLVKTLPIASGIGGGSADAAATLLAFAKLYGDIPLSKLLNIGGQLGADVPMCLYSQALRAQGIGSDIHPINNMPKLYLLLVNPGIEIATPQIFKSLDSKNNTPMANLPSHLTATKLIDWLAHQRNDLQLVTETLAPQISVVLHALQQRGARLVRMSGSGATCFGIFDNDEACKAAANEIQKAQPNWWVMPTETKNYGPERARLNNEAR